MNIGKETEYVEFKRSTSETKEGIISICAMLNKHKRGVLYFGVRNDGEVVGQDIGSDTLNKLSHDISDHIDRSFLYDVEKLQTAEGKEYIEVSFSGSKTPYSAYGRYYLRFHDEDRVMDSDMLRELLLSNTNDYSYWEKARSLSTIDDIDYDELDRFYTDATEIGRIKVENKEYKSLLKRLGLMYDDIYLNKAGEALFSKNGPVKVRLTTFASETRITIIDTELFEGNTFSCIRRSLDYIKEHIDWNIDFDGSVKRIEKPEIPLEAIREIVVNAFSHGEYEANTDFDVSIFKDRVSIYSPGRFPKPYTPEEYAAGNLQPVPMNELISHVLYLSGTIEKISTGFERTFGICDENNVSYTYEEIVTGFRFDFYRGHLDPRKLSDIEKDVLEELKRKNDMTGQELAKKLDVTTRTITRALSTLKLLGYIQREGSDRSGSWKILL